MANRLILIVFGLAATVVIVSDACGFGGGGGCGGPPAPATCAAPAPPPVSNCGGCGGGSSCGSSCGGASSCGGGCGGCRTLRRYYHRRHVREASEDNKTVTLQYVDSVRVKQSQDDDPTCNSQQLRQIIELNLSADPEKSKEAIHRAAVKKFSGYYAVVCSEVGFTFKADSHHYCLHGNDQMYCYVFQTAKDAKE